MTEPTSPLGPLLGSLGDLVGQIARTLQTGAGDGAARSQAAAQIDQLGALVARIDHARPQDGLALVDLTQLRNALSALSQALRSPANSPAAVTHASADANAHLGAAADADANADADQAIARLRALMAPLTGDDPVRDAAAERDRIRKQASDAIDDYFRANPLRPFKG